MKHIKAPRRIGGNVIALDELSAWWPRHDVAWSLGDICRHLRRIFCEVYIELLRNFHYATAEAWRHCVLLTKKQLVASCLIHTNAVSPPPDFHVSVDHQSIPSIHGAALAHYPTLCKLLSRGTRHCGLCRCRCRCLCRCLNFMYCHCGLHMRTTRMFYMWRIIVLMCYSSLIRHRNSLHVPYLLYIECREPRI